MADVPNPGAGQNELPIEVDFAEVRFIGTLFRSGAFVLSVPFIPGIEVTGRVRAMGPGVTGFAPAQPIGALTDFGRRPVECQKSAWPVRCSDDQVGCAA
jgi:NADPH2:quinone reductase